MRTAHLLPVSPTMHCLGRGCTWSGGVPGPWGGVPGLGVYLVPGGVYLVPGVYLVLGGVPSWGGKPGLGGCTLSQGGTCPGTPPCEQNDWQTGVKILPCPKLRLRAVVRSFLVGMLKSQLIHGMSGCRRFGTHSGCFTIISKIYV